MTQKAIFNWSSGKDSALALYKCINSKKYDIVHLLTTVNKKYNRVSMHGVSVELLRRQAENIGIPLIEVALSETTTMEEYDNTMRKAMNEIHENGIDISIFGDIFLEDLKKYREDKLSESKMSAHFPLWKIPTDKLIHEFIDLGFKAVISCVNGTYLDKSFTGRIIDDDFIKDLPENVDPCGENGEFHSFVFDGPIFKKPIDIVKGDLTCVKFPAPKNINNSNSDNEIDEYNIWYCDLKINN